jgi:hypothetical protein
VAYCVALAICALLGLSRTCFPLGLLGPFGAVRRRASCEEDQTTSLSPCAHLGYRTGLGMPSLGGQFCSFVSFQPAAHTNSHRVEPLTCATHSRILYRILQLQVTNYIYISCSYIAILIITGPTTAWTDRPVQGRFVYRGVRTIDRTPSIWNNTTRST